MPSKLTIKTRPPYIRATLTSGALLEQLACSALFPLNQMHTLKLQVDTSTDLTKVYLNLPECLLACIAFQNLKFSIQLIQTWQQHLDAQTQ